MSEAVDEPVRAHCHLDDDAQPLLVLCEGGQVGRQSLRQHGKDLRGRVHGGGVCARVLIQRASPAAPRHRRRRRPRGCPPRHRASACATDNWSRSRESSLSIEHHKSARRSRICGSALLAGPVILLSCACTAAGGKVRLQSVIQHRAARDILQPTRRAVRVVLWHCSMITGTADRCATKGEGRHGVISAPPFFPTARHPAYAGFSLATGLGIIPV